MSEHTDWAGDTFPPVPGDLIDALDRHFPPSLPITANVPTLPEADVRALMGRVLGRRDAVNFLRAVHDAQTSRSSEDAGGDSPAPSADI